MRRIAASVAAALLVCLATPGAAGAAVGDELLANPGVETGTGTPASWTAGTWGAGTTVFTWSTDAHTGTRSTRTEVTSYTDGDSKWAPDPVRVSGGAYYTFSDWYKSNASTAVSVQYWTTSDTSVDGKWANLYAGIAPASQWTQYSTGFTMPASAVYAQFVHLIARKGYLQTDDSSVREQAAPPGFSRPMISLSFDDGSQSLYDLALPLLDAKGFKSTQYVPTADLAAGDPYLMSASELRTIAAAGHEVASHSVTHPDLTTLSTAALANELTASKQLLEQSTSTPVLDLAYPFGAYDARVIAAARSAGYTMARSVEDGYNSRLDLEPFDLRGQNILDTTTPADFQAWVNYAKAHNYWLVVIYHEVVPDSAPACTDPETVSPCKGPYDTSVSDFKAQLNALVTSGLSADVLPVGAAMASAQSQLHAPTAGSVALSPSPVTRNAAVTATLNGFRDVDGDMLTYHFRWTADGTPLSGQTAATIDLAKLADLRGHTLGVTVSADDGHGNASPEVSETAAVVDVAPVAGSVTLAASGTTLTATPSRFSDADGDSLTYSYAWYRNGVALPDTGATLSSASDAIRVEVRAGDGFGGFSATVSAQVTLPVVPPQPTASPTPMPTPSSTPAPTVTPPADRSAPVIAITSPRPRAYRRGTRLVIRFSCADPSGMKEYAASLRRIGADARLVRRGATVRLSRTGRYVLRVRATDRLGNTSIKTVAFRVIR